MKIKQWTSRVLWFVLGVVVATSITVVNAHRTPPPQDLEERVMKLEKSVKDLWEAVGKKADQPKPDRSRN